MNSSGVSEFRYLFSAATKSNPNGISLQSPGLLVPRNPALRAEIPLGFASPSRHAQRVDTASENAPVNQDSSGHNYAELLRMAGEMSRETDLTGLLLKILQRSHP